MAALLGLTLAACGGGGGADAPAGPAAPHLGSSTPAAGGTGSAAAANTTGTPFSQPFAGNGTGISPTASLPPGAISSPGPQTGSSHPAPSLPTWTLGSEAEVSRLLAQAGFGASPLDLRQLKGKTVNAWIEAEFAKPQTRLLGIVDHWQKTRGTARVTMDDTHNAWWYAAMQDDQLRQRVAFALSQIFVVSSNGAPGNYPRGMANYYDLLSRHAFGNFRDLLEDVTLSPMMGLYLTHLHNRRERFNNAGEQVSTPDENYAREVMQLFTIGLEMLEADGTPRLDGRGDPIPTYSNDDILGLARVLTGWGWAGPRSSTDCFYSIGSCQAGKTPDRELKPMKAYPHFHSTMEKRFLGVTIPAGQETPEANLKIALDTLFQHPNVGPFIGKQLIQRLVSSNPSPAYVRRVASAFNDNGAGVRGDMKAVIRAILLDREARQPGQHQHGGRIREPLLRFVHLTRAFELTSTDGHWGLGRTDGANSLNQTAMRAPSVFNFYRPGYSPANTPVARAGLVAPEMQILNESSLAGYASYLDQFVGASSSYSIGLGRWIETTDPANPARKVGRRQMQFNYQPLLERAAQPEKLVDYLDTLLLAGQMRADTRRLIVDAISQISYPPARNQTPERMERVHWNRAGLAVYLSLMSTDYQVLK